MIGKFINLMNVLESQVDDWEVNENLTKDQVINEIRTIIRGSKELKK